jgi:homoserine O-succinyltransferase/O-acetyltransferase
MPIAIEGGRIPALLKLAKGFASPQSTPPETAPLRIALVNNMPDAALEDTEFQFFELLSKAAGEIHVSLKFFSLPNLPRNESGQKHLHNFYSSSAELLRDTFDGAIITGTEPRSPDLREEPYWPALVEVMNWAEHKTSSTVLSCLAAHAGVLASDQIPRSPLADKQFGVFEYQKMSPHPLTAGIGDTMRVAHSRWNETKAGALASHGYQILTQSPSAGVDLFVKQRHQSLFVHFQGHPEYSTKTLLKEYRRDIKRFLRQERETYPTQPHGYFDAAATQLLEDFRVKAIAIRDEATLADFSESAVAATVQNTWQSTSATVYRNWLQYLRSKKTETQTTPAMTPAIRA